VTNPAINFAGLPKTCDEVVASDGASLEVSYGSVLGLLGPNGSGKTTAGSLLPRPCDQIRVKQASAVSTWSTTLALSVPWMLWPVSSLPSMPTGPTRRIWSSSGDSRLPRKFARDRATELLESSGLNDPHIQPRDGSSLDLSASGRRHVRPRQTTGVPQTAAGCPRGRDMTEPSKRPLPRRIQAGAMRVVNVPMRVVLGLPIPTLLGRRLMLAFITGRKTGKTYRQPLSYVNDASTLLTPGGGKWRRNLVDGQPVRLRLRGQDVFARPELVADVDEVDRLLCLILAANPRADSFVRVPKGPDGRLDRDRLRTAIQYGFRIVRWHLDEP
jgi:hypothetical protein